MLPPAPECSSDYECGCVTSAKELENRSNPDAFVRFVDAAWRASLLVNWKIVCNTLGIILLIPAVILIVLIPLIDVLFTTYAAPPSSKNRHPARFFPARTTHTRLFPKRHSFSYSYFLVGVPVGSSGRAGPLLSTDIEKDHESAPALTRGSLTGWIPASWLHWLVFYGLPFRVVAEDHLQRDDGQQWTLKRKMEEFLRSRDSSLLDYTFAYLITAPRFLGYCFNPVSFWYIYREQELVAVILEVNNTFDERHCYLVYPKEGKVPSAVSADHKTPREGEPQVEGRKPIFRGSQPKLFHVSPFNSRHGSYDLAVHDTFSDPDPAGEQVRTIAPPDNTITLRSSSGSVKLVARIFGTEPAINPFLISRPQALRLILRFWWVGLMTFPRIIREAAKLFFRRRLQVFYRPEPRVVSIGRRETAQERKNEAAFEEFMRFLAEEKYCGTLAYRCEALIRPRRVLYRNGAKVRQEDPHKRKERSDRNFIAQDDDDDDDDVDAVLVEHEHEHQHEPQRPPRPGLEIKVLTPAFYATLAQHSSFSQAITQGMFPGDPQRCTVVLSRTELDHDGKELDRRSPIDDEGEVLAALQLRLDVGTEERAELLQERWEELRRKCRGDGWTGWRWRWPEGLRRMGFALGGC